MKLPLIYYGHPLLRKKTKSIEAFDATLMTLVENMKETASSYRALGLSAPQVGVGYGLFITNLPEQEHHIGYIPGIPKVYINTKIEEISETTWYEEEGCLSIPKIYEGVERPLTITITSQNEYGVWRTEHLKGWQARVVLHENDHINGVLFIDRLVRRDRKRLEKQLQLMKKKFESHNNAISIIE